MHPIHNTTDKAGSGQADGAVGKLEKGSGESAALWQAIFAAMGQTAPPVLPTDPPSAGSDQPTLAEAITPQLQPANMLPQAGLPLPAKLPTTPVSNPITNNNDATADAIRVATDGSVVIDDTNNDDNNMDAADPIPLSMPFADDSLIGTTIVADADTPALTVPLVNFTTPVQVRSRVQQPVMPAATPTQPTVIENDQLAPDQRLPELIAAGPDIIPSYLQAQAGAPKSPAWESARPSIIPAKMSEVATNATTVLSNESQPIIAASQGDDAKKIDPARWVSQMAAPAVENLQQNTKPAATTRREPQFGKISPITDGLLNRADVSSRSDTPMSDFETAVSAPVVSKTANVERAAELNKVLTLSGVARDFPVSTPVDAAKPVNDAPQARQPVGQQIIQAFTARPAQMGQQVSIRLDPPDMGSVKLTLKTDRGEIRGVVEVDNARTLAELKSETPSLLARLADSGVQVRGMEFVLTHDGSGSGQHSAYAGFGDRHNGGQADTGGQNYNEQPDVELPILSTTAGEVVDNEAINIWV